MKLEFPKKLIKNFLRDFLPSKHILLICILFYILGIVFGLMNPYQASLIFSDGMFLGNMEVQIQMPAVITFEYALNQFIYYFGAYSVILK